MIAEWIIIKLFGVIAYNYINNEVQCNGNTSGFGPLIPGSNPGTSTKQTLNIMKINYLENLST